MAKYWTKHEPEDIVDQLSRHLTKEYGKRNPSDYKRIVVHTTDWETDPATIALYDIKPNHISETGCPAITYHDMITKGGKVFHTLPYDEISWHVGMWNRGSLAVALIYRCTEDGKDTIAPTTKALKSLYAHCGDLCIKHGILPDKVVGHRELKGTGWLWFKGSKKLRKTCPGLQVNMDYARVIISKYVQTKLQEKGLYKGKIDGIFGRGSKEAFKCL